MSDTLTSTSAIADGEPCCRPSRAPVATAPTRRARAIGAQAAGATALGAIATGRWSLQP